VRRARKAAEPYTYVAQGRAFTALYHHLAR
jgi:hypothetical protein